MSQHPSLRTGKGRQQQRSVLKRHERLKILLEKDTWHEGDSVFGLPKVKVVKFKIKKAAAEEPTAEATPAAPGAEATEPTAAKPEAPKEKAKGAKEKAKGPKEKAKEKAG